MRRTLWALPAALLLALLLGPSRAADADLSGNYKVVLLTNERAVYWLLSLESKDGKLTAKVLDARKDLPEATVDDVKLAGDKLTFNLKLGGNNVLAFEGAVGKDGKAVRGSLQQGESLIPTELEPTAWKEIDRFETNKEIVAAGGDNLRFFNAVMALLRDASAKKAKPEDVRAWADKANKAAESFGPRFQRDIVFKIADALAGQEGFADVALPYARRAEKLLDPKASGPEQARVLNLLLTALRKAGKADEVKEVEARLEKIDLSVATTKFAGRKGMSDRVVLVEFFTCAECQTCVGPERAFDGLLKSYAPNEAVFLEYHLHTPGPDPMTNEDTETRSTFYGKAVEDTPTMLVNGDPLRDVGGGADDAADLYKGLSGLLARSVEEPSKAKLTLKAAQKGDKIEASAEVAELQDAGSQVKLRFVLVEDEVRYAGANGLRTHHNVVRAFPGGVNGVAVKTKTFSQTASVDLDELRKSLTKYLDEQAKANPDRPFPNKERPLELKNLKVVALLQNDKTKEILQAAQVDVKAE